MRRLFMFICLGAYALSFFEDLRPWGFTSTSGVLTRLTYIFVHLGLVHLFLNMLSFRWLFREVSRDIKAEWLALAMVAGAFLATYGSELSQPTIGASGVVMFLLGCYTVQRPSTHIFITLGLVALANVANYYLAHTNPFIHFYSFIYGLLFTATLVIPKTCRKNLKNAKNNLNTSLPARG